MRTRHVTLLSIDVSNTRSTEDQTPRKPNPSIRVMSAGSTGPAASMIARGERVLPVRPNGKNIIVLANVGVQEEQIDALDPHPGQAADFPKRSKRRRLHCTISSASSRAARRSNDP
jgi:hypothetical protein